MKLHSLQVTNFRCFESLTVEFDPQLTVLVANNGMGKTAILDAITVALGPFISGFDTGVNKGFKHEDSRLGIKLIGTKKIKIRIKDSAWSVESKYPIKLNAAGIIEDQLIQWSRELKGEKTQTTVGDAKLLTKYAKKLQLSVRADEQVTLPVIAYYGTGRLWRQSKPNLKYSTDSKSRLYGYQDALNSESDFKAVSKWFKDESLAQFNEIVANIMTHQHLGNIDISPLKIPYIKLEHVRKAVDRCLNHSGWSTLYYDAELQQLVIRHKDDKLLDAFIPVAQLSDGVKAMLSLVADIAYRCVQLNPHLASPPEETSGVVLIDEIELHLHPSWQQHVINDLQTAFPNIQFIVTTHSPQVLTTIPANSIRLLEMEWDEETGRDCLVVKPVSQQTLGVASSDVLAEAMGTDPVPDVEQARQLSQYKALIQQNLHEKEPGPDLRAQLDQHFGPQHPAILECDRLIRLQNFKRQLPRRDQSNA